MTRFGVAVAISPATPTQSVARRGLPNEERRVRGEPAGYELREEPHALRLAGLSLREEPQRSVDVQAGARHPVQQRVGISDEARQRRDPATICASPSVVLNGTAVVRISPSQAQRGTP
jgi:hypothetical protein